MKKTEIQHPKLYLSAMRDKKHQIKALYVSNKFDTSGNLEKESIILDNINTNTSSDSFLIRQNKIELKKLNIFIARHKKVVSIFRAKGKGGQLRVVSDSLDLLFELRSTFENWFNEIGCTT